MVGNGGRAAKTFDTGDANVVHFELYDMENDPYEKNNLAEGNPELVQALFQDYNNWWDEVRPFMVNDGVPLAKEAPFVVRYEKQLKEKGIPDWTPPQL